MAIQISPWWYAKPDGCIYLSIARSMAKGTQLTALGNPHLVTTPGYPALISPAFLTGDRPFLMLSILHWMMATICIVGVYYWARRHSPSIAILLTALAMVNAAVWLHYRRTIKEIAFMAVVIWTVNVMHAILHDKHKSVLQTAVLTVLAALLVTLSAMIRYPGLVLAAGFGVVMLLATYRGRISWVRAATVTLMVSVPASTVVMWHIQHEENMAQKNAEATYLQSFQAAVRHIFHEPIFGTSTDKPTVMQDDQPSEIPTSGKSICDNQLVEGLRLQISSLGQLTLPGMFKANSGRGKWLTLNMIIYLIWLVFLLVGWWYLFGHKNDVFATSLPFYLILYIIWPFDQGVRFLVVTAPLVTTCGWFGMRRLLPLKGVSMLSIGVILHLTVSTIYWLGTDAPRAYALHLEWPKVEQIAEEISGDPRPVAIVNIDQKLQKKISYWVQRRLRLMLMLAIDRPVQEYKSQQQVSADIHWVVLPAGITLDEKFQLKKHFGDYQLVSRKLSPNAPLAQTAQHRKSQAQR